MAAAVTWAMALVLFKRSGETVSPLSLSLFKSVVGCLLMALTVWLTNDYFAASSAGPHRIADLSPSQIGILLASGILGIAIADTLLFFALNTIGVGLVTVAECSYTPSVMFLAWLWLNEPLKSHHLIGAALVLSGLLLASTHAPPPGRTRGQLLWGSALAVLAIALMAVGIVWAKPVLEQAPLLPATLLRLIGGTLALALILGIDQRRKRHFAVFRPTRTWRTMLPASILGTYLAMIFWVGGFKYTEASIAAVLNQTSMIFALIMATIFLREPFTSRKGLAAGLALAGVVVVTRNFQG